MNTLQFQSKLGKLVVWVSRWKNTLLALDKSFKESKIKLTKIRGINKVYHQKEYLTSYWIIKTIVKALKFKKTCLSLDNHN